MKTFKQKPASKTSRKCCYSYTGVQKPARIFQTSVTQISTLARMPIIDSQARQNPQTPRFPSPEEQSPPSSGRESSAKLTPRAVKPGREVSFPDEKGDKNKCQIELDPNHHLVIREGARGAGTHRDWARPLAASLRRVRSFV